MSIYSVAKVLQVKSYTGLGVIGDPCRIVTTYISAETGEILDVVDHYINDERIRLLGEKEANRG